MVKNSGIYCFSSSVNVRQAVKRAGGVRGGGALAEDSSETELLNGTRISVTVSPSSLLIDKMDPYARFLYFIPIDVNEASAEELVVIPGIGEKTARAILEYRRQHGSFSTVEELKKVRGIGTNNFLKMKEYFSNLT